ncbi:putative ankyrin repeat protein [Zopfochytrium polystomum]|nr:putative ankyrin repeat protein [Zopfochytrium polystomum]
MGSIDVLQWWKDSGLELRYRSVAMDLASERGQAHILQWWKDSGYDLKYTSFAVSGAADSGHIKTLQWWRDSGLQLDWATFSFQDASNETVLEWWEKSGLFKEWLNRFKNRRDAFEEVLQGEGFSTRSDAVKQWWRDHFASSEEPRT